MIKRRKLTISVVSLALALTLTACGAEEEETPVEEPIDIEENTEVDHGDDHAHMDHSSSGEVPDNLKEAEDPTYSVGSTAIIADGHMSGMEGAQATIVGAYETTAYIISYTPTTGGERVENHKWVIHEELVDPGNDPLGPGSEATTDASHMEGMEGATVEIDGAEQTTVYMVDFTLTTTGEEVTNHKWVTESELAPVK